MVSPVPQWVEGTYPVCACGVCVLMCSVFVSAAYVCAMYTCGVSVELYVKTEVSAVSEQRTLGFLCSVPVHPVNSERISE